MHYKIKFQLSFFLSGILLCMGCSTLKNLVNYSRNYIEVGKVMDSVQLPYIVELHKNNKHLIAVGISHTYDYNNPQIAALKKLYLSFKPDITINEGG